MLHAADVWSTVQGVKYDCIIEANPLLPEVPHRDRLLIHKAFFLQPFHMVTQQDAITNEDMVFPIALASWVVYNNIKLTNQAKKKCNLR